MINQKIIRSGDLSLVIGMFANTLDMLVLGSIYSTEKVQLTKKYNKKNGFLHSNFSLTCDLNLTTEKNQ